MCTALACISQIRILIFLIVSQEGSSEREAKRTTHSVFDQLASGSGHNFPPPCGVGPAARRSRTSDMTLSSPARNVSTTPPAPRLSMLSHIQIASLWFALFTQWMTVVPVLVPARADEREELEPFAESGRRRLARAANRQPKAEQHDRNERGNRGIQVTRRIERNVLSRSTPASELLLGAGNPPVR